MTEVKGFLSLSRRLALSGLKGSFLLISLKTPSVIYFQNPLSNCEKFTKYSKEDYLAKSRNKLLSYISEDLLHI